MMAEWWHSGCCEQWLKTQVETTKDSYLDQFNKFISSGIECILSKFACEIKLSDTLEITKVRNVIQ